MSRIAYNVVIINNIAPCLLQGYDSPVVDTGIIIAPCLI